MASESSWPQRLDEGPARLIFLPVDQPLEFRLDELGMNNTEGCESQGDLPCQKADARAPSANNVAP